MFFTYPACAVLRCRALGAFSTALHRLRLTHFRSFVGTQGPRAEPALLAEGPSRCAARHVRGSGVDAQFCGIALATWRANSIKAALAG
jgi:hypothetical protein